MSPHIRLRQRISTTLHMVLAFVIIILLGQLWLFTLTLEAVQTKDASPRIWAAALTCSVVGCAAVWVLIRYFLRTEKDRTHNL